MAFKGTLAGISGRRLFFGERLCSTPDGKQIKQSDVAKGEHCPPTNHWEHEFTLKQDGKVLRASGDGGLDRANWSKATEANLSDLKNGMEICCCGVSQDDVSGECHSVIFAPILSDDQKAKVAKTEKKAAERAKAASKHK